MFKVIQMSDLYYVGISKFYNKRNKREQVTVNPSIFPSYLASHTYVHEALQCTYNIIYIVIYMFCVSVNVTLVMHGSQFTVV